MSLRVGIAGGGSFGRAIALAAARNGHESTLWSRSQKDIDESVRQTTELDELAKTDLLVLAVPSRHVPSLADQLGEHLDGGHLVVHVSRGLVGEELSPITTIVRRRTAARRLGALAGPLVADALAEGRPSGAVIGTRFPEVEQTVREAIGGPAVRLYHTNDVVGVQVASATVGMLAVLVGYAKQTNADPGSIAVLATRGIAEAARIGQTFGCTDATFHGLAGLGDLVSVVAGDDRPESRLGRALASGLDLSRAKGEAGAFIEGIQVARDLIIHSNRLGVETPILSVFVSVIDGDLSPDRAAEALMLRQVKKE